MFSGTYASQCPTVYACSGSLGAAIGLSRDASRADTEPAPRTRSHRRRIRTAAGRTGQSVLIQSMRGTFGSEGIFDLMRQEREGGLATLHWLVKGIL